MACPCNNPTIIAPNPTCKDCIVAKTVRYTCDNSPNPCGESVTLDLSAINKIDACGNCGATYTIKKYDIEGFDSVSITSGGVLTYVTSDKFVKQKEYEITYKITCNCGEPQLSTTAKVYVCRKDLCRTAPKGAACNQCNGDYIYAKNAIVTKNSSPLNKCSGTGTYALSSLVEETLDTPMTYTLVSASSGLSSVSVNSETGLLTYSKLGEGYEPQTIVWAVSSGSLYAQATLTIEIKNLCEGVICGSGYQCDECEGECIESLVDLEIVP